MEIKKAREGSKLTLCITGRLDTITAPLLEEELRSSLGDISELVFDFKDLAYISSAGLRVLLAAQKEMNGRGSMTICHVIPEIMEIFEVTGFVDILNIQM